MSSAVETARRVLRVEADAVAALIDRVGPSFEQAIELLGGVPGRIVVAGLGKSGIIGRKVASTLASTGSPSLFLHAAEALHGDMGMIARGDALLALSNSGTTGEVLEVCAAAERLGVPVVALTGATDSELARLADVVLDAGVASEACPHDLAPTASTTATLALGDAIAIALLTRRDFRPDDYASLHRGGALGRRLRTVDELVHAGSDVPRVPIDASVSAVLAEITAKRLGMTVVTEADGGVAGVITDGDIRRAVEVRGDLRPLTARDLVTRYPKQIAPDALAERALALMEQHRITCLLVRESPTADLIGVVHLHDLLRAGLG